MYVQRNHIDPFILNELNYSAHALPNIAADTGHLEHTYNNDARLSLEIKNKLSAKLSLGNVATTMRGDLQKKITKIILIVEEELYS
tara:strand:+ start:172 stop:429 length:258 start_codon:yes stop_codon:yes gene_type:complete